MDWVVFSYHGTVCPEYWVVRYLTKLVVLFCIVIIVVGVYSVGSPSRVEECRELYIFWRGVWLVYEVKVTENITSNTSYDIHIFCCECVMFRGAV